MSNGPQVETGIVIIRTKQGDREYHTVAKRVRDFREQYPDYTIKTKLLSTADLVTVRAQIFNESGRLLATGHAEKNRAVGINQVCAVENAETHAAGRALSLLGFGGTEIASAEEIQAALDEEKELTTSQRLLDHNESVRDHLGSIVVIKGALDREDYSTAKEAWGELDNESKASLWLAPTKGGIFTTREREQMKSNEWSAAL